MEESAGALRKANDMMSIFSFYQFPSSAIRFRPVCLSLPTSFFVFVFSASYDYGAKPTIQKLDQPWLFAEGSSMPDDALPTIR